MAPFNPDLGISDTQVRDQTGASRGTQGDRSFEVLFKGLGDAIGGAANAVDTSIQERIEKDARYGFDSLNDEMNLSTTTAPPELIRSGEGLQKLNDAHLQGKISQEYYYGRLAATLKGLRSKYPGYEKEVDAIVQNVTGVRPANAYRDALWNSMDSLRQQQQQSAGKFEAWAGQQGNNATIGILFPDFWTNPEKYSTPEAQNQVKAQVSQYQGRVQLADDTVKLQSSDKTIARPQVGRLFGTVVQGFIAGGASAVGVDQPNVQNMIQNALSDGTIDQTEKENILGFLGQIRAKAEVDLRNRVASSDWGSNFTSAEVNEEIKSALDPITQMEALVTSDNVSGAMRIAERNKAMSDQATYELYDKFPELRTAGALRSISEAGADQVVQELIEKSGGGLGFVNRAIGKDLATGVASGSVSLSQVTQRVAEAEGKTAKEKEGILSQVLDATTSVLAAPDASKEIRLKTVQSVYSDNLDATWKVVSDETGSSGISQRMRLFSKMFNPEITKQIAALNDPQAMETYTAAAIDKFQQIPEFRRAAATLGEQIPYNKYARVRYDESKNRMVVEVNKEALGNTSWFRRTDEAIARRELTQATDTFNRAVQLMAPIIEASGVDESEGIAQLAESLALNLEGGNPGLWNWISTGIVENIDKALTGRVSPEGGVAREGSRLYEAGRQNFEEQSRAVDPNQTGQWEEVGGSADIGDDPVLWEVPDGTPVNPASSSGRLADQGDLIGEVLETRGSAQSGQTNLLPERQLSEGQRAIQRQTGGGLADLVTSRARGYQPDMDNLDAGFKSSLSELQQTFGKELPIVSGYRDPARNRRAGGASKSRHMHGDAVDIDVRNLSRQERIDLIQKARSLGFGGVGIYPNSIHLDKGATRAWGPTYRNSSLPKWARDALGG